MKNLNLILFLCSFIISFQSLSMSANGKKPTFTTTEPDEELSKAFMSVVRQYAEEINNKGLVKAIDEADTKEKKSHIVDCIYKDPGVVGHASKDIINFYEDLLVYQLTKEELLKIRPGKGKSGPGWVIGNGGEDDSKSIEHYLRNSKLKPIEKNQYGDRFPAAAVNLNGRSGPGWVIGNGGEDDFIMDLDQVRYIKKSLGI